MNDLVRLWVPSWSSSPLLSSGLSEAQTKLSINPGCLSKQMIRYGHHPSQVVHLWDNDSIHSNETIVFVHGGAWGSGYPGMYTGSTDHKYTLKAHSSGAHICSLAMTLGILPGSSVDRFISLAGIFDIPEHYRFEIARDVSRFSPMVPACAGVVGATSGDDNHQGATVLAKWRNSSPLHTIQKVAAAVRSNSMEGTRAYVTPEIFPGEILWYIASKTPFAHTRILKTLQGN